MQCTLYTCNCSHFALNDSNKHFSTTYFTPLSVWLHVKERDFANLLRPYFICMLCAQDDPINRADSFLTGHKWMNNNEGWMRSSKDLYETFLAKSSRQIPKGTETSIFGVYVMYRTERSRSIQRMDVRMRKREGWKRNREIVFLCLSPVRNRRPYPLCCDKMGYQQ